MWLERGVEITADALKSIWINRSLNNSGIKSKSLLC
jgi:hypothetical protein